MAHVVNILFSPPDSADPKPETRYDRVPVEVVELAPGKGIVGDRKGRSRTRQLNIMSAATTAALGAEGFKVAAGELGEQLVVAGLDVNTLPVGTRIRLGAAVVEVTIPRTGCGRFEAIQGKPAEAAAGRLGVLVKVVERGSVRVGDPVAVVPAEAVTLDT